MSRRPAPPSSSPRTTGRTADRSRPETGTIDVRGWVSGIRLSTFMVIMLSLVVLGAWVLVPTLGTYIEQRQKIAALEQAVHVSEERIAELKAERDRWNDPAYVQSQARARFGYLMPGETSYVVLGADGKPLESQTTLLPKKDVIVKEPTAWWATSASSRRRWACAAW